VKPEQIQLAYVAHPVGADGPRRVANLERALRWMRWLIVHHEAVAFVAPWLPYCQVLTEKHRARGMRDTFSVLARCDAIVLVGGQLSPGMADELGFMRERGRAVIDYLHHGDEPPRMS
jgi:hypothetical protein